MLLQYLIFAIKLGLLLTTLSDRVRQAPMLNDGLTLQSLLLCGAENALAGYDQPILLIKYRKDVTAPVVFDTPNTNILSPGDTSFSSAGVANTYIEPNTVVVPLQKTTRNSFSSLITLGRAGNNDLIIADKTVSKVHGWFLMPEEPYSLWRFLDNMSTNGTKVNGEVIPPKSATFIKPSDELVMGDVSLLFMTADDVCNLCLYLKKEWKRALTEDFPKYFNADTIRLDQQDERATYFTRTANRPFQKTSL